MLLNKPYTGNNNCCINIVALKTAIACFVCVLGENYQFFADLKTLVEETYAMNNDQPITFVVHSMGGPMTLLFLQLQSDDWKEKHISRLISLAGAWAGSVKALKVYAIGQYT